MRCCKDKRLANSWLNGTQAERIALQDRGLNYGDGFFTTALVVKGQIVNQIAHQARLLDSADRLGFTSFDGMVLWAEVKEFINQIDLDAEYWVLKIMITRGVGGKGYQALPLAQTNRLLLALPAPPHVQEDSQWAWYPLAQVGLCQTRWGTQPLLAGMKHLNRLENVLARNELLNTHWDEGLMLNQAGEVVSGTQSNVCILIDGQWHTPDLTNCGVAGTTLAWLRERFDVMMGAVSVSALRQADEIIFCNAVRGIQPLKQFEQTTLCTEQGQAWARQWQADILALS